uniref:Serine/threonine specific protein phosphatases domain-containing protein n=1 Tax=Romanomermis culicivorax TaxID=13658 RepID=A0A915L567_ROMCU
GKTKDLLQIKQLKRPFDIPAYGLSCDLVWSDPDEDHKGWSQNTRNLSFTFGNDIVLDFCRQMNVAMIVRGHQTKYKKSKSIPRRGYRFFAGSRLLTLFSVPNYMGMAKNEGTVLSVDPNMSCQFEILKPTRQLALTYNNS